MVALMSYLIRTEAHYSNIPSAIRLQGCPETSKNHMVAAANATSIGIISTAKFLFPAEHVTRSSSSATLT